MIMTPNQPPEEKKLSHTAIRVGILVSALTILTTVWTTVIQPVLTLQRQLELGVYRITELEKDVVSLNSRVAQLEQEKQRNDRKSELSAYKKIPEQ